MELRDVVGPPGTWTFTDLHDMVSWTAVGEAPRLDRDGVVAPGGPAGGLTGVGRWTRIGERIVAPMAASPTAAPIWTSIRPDGTFDVGRPIAGCQSSPRAEVIPVPGAVLVAC